MGLNGDEPTGVRRLTLALAAVAAVAVELAAAEPERPQWRCAGFALAAYDAPALAAAWYIRRKTRRRGGEPARGVTLKPAAVATLLALFAAPIAAAVVSGRRPEWDMALIAAVRNLGLGLAVAAATSRPAFARLSAVLSLFLVLFAAALGDGPWVLASVGLYAVLGTLWLVLSYWGRATAGTPGPARRSPPLAVLSGLSAVIVGAVALASVGPPDVAVVLAALAPTSGGTEWNDPDARGGVNDGDNEVGATENPRSVGFTQSEIYLDTDRPSLYDAFNEAYGEPYKPREMKRMVALGPQDVREQGERPSENLQAGREFSLVRKRKPRSSPRRPSDRAAKALVYVKGTTPLHLALAAYDRFDGRAWSEGPTAGHVCEVEHDGRTGWFRLRRPGCDVFAGTAAHQVKIGSLDSSPMPLPSHPSRLRVGSVDRADFFGWAQDGVVRMVDRTVPAGTVVDVESWTVDPSKLGGAGLRPRGPHAPIAYQGLDGYDIDPRVEALAMAWTRGVPEGWSHVRAVVYALRARCVHDRLAADASTGGGVDPVAHFLFDHREGPDYLFATAAVVLLRSLGYPARVVSGLYASPDRYDPRTRHTPVTDDDVHFWAEVYLPGGAWVAVEPTPGYELAGPSLSAGARLAAWARTVWSRLVANRAALALAAVGALALWRVRREGLDALATAAWVVRARGPARSCVLSTLALIERRSGWAGRPRPPAETLRRWYASAGGDLARLVRLADWALYAPDAARDQTPCEEADLRAVCDRVARSWTLGRFRQTAKECAT